MNLFRRLGWEEPRDNPFGLAGIVQGSDGPRALITRGDRPAGLYVQVGADVGDGYAVVDIGSRTVKLAGGALGEVTLELDPSVVGTRGGARGRGPGSAGGEPDEAEGYQWYPERGLSEEELILSILDREGLTMEDMYNDGDLAEEIGEKYKYLKDEGYVPDDAQHWR